MAISLFPGYLFANFSYDVRVPVVNAPGVQYIVSPGNIATPVSDSELLAIRRALEAKLQVRSWDHVPSGKAVRVSAGPLRGAEGILESVMDERKLIVTLSLLNRSVAVSMQQEWVEPC